MKYILDVNQLKVGDIILESGYTKVVSKTIKKATKSKYSHAILYVDHSAIHAVSGGVFSKNPQRMLVDSIDDLKVLRLKEEYDSEFLDRACAYARDRVGSLYSKVEAAAALNFSGSNKAAKTKKQYCSRLVAQSYYNAGISLVNNVDYCSPEDINKSELLREVKGCVRKAYEEDINFEKTIDPNIKNQEETFKWLKLSRKLFSRDRVDIQSLGDVSRELMNNPKNDKRICKYIESTKYLFLYDVDRQHNEYRYDYKLYSDKLLMDVDKEELINSEINLNIREYKRHSVNFINSRDNFKKSMLKYFKLHIKLYRNILSEIRCRVEVLDQVTRNMPYTIWSHEIGSLKNHLNELLN